MGRHVIGQTTDIPVGKRKIVKLEGREIGVFNVKGTYYALRNSCPHQSAPLCQGTVTGMTLPSKPGEYKYGREDEILRCPWHGWEFDITTGQSIFDPFKCRVRTYEVTVEHQQSSDETVQKQTGGVAESMGIRFENRRSGGTDESKADATTEEDEWPQVETYPVTVEAGNIVVHL